MIQITPNLLSISTDMAHIPIGTTIPLYAPETGKQPLVLEATNRITLRHHKGAFVGCFSLRLKKNIDWELFKRWKVNRNPSLTDQMARDFLPFLQTPCRQVIRNHLDLIITAPPSANRCPQRYCIHDLAKAISSLTGIPFVPAFSQKQTRCTTGGMPASVNRNLGYSNPGISGTDPSFSWMTASPPKPQPGSAMRPC